MPNDDRTFRFPKLNSQDEYFIVSEPRSLQELQRWLQTVIKHPDGVSDGIAGEEAASILDVTASQIERVILPSHEMTSLDRLQIYGHAYFARLIECLRAQFPAVHHALGDQVFDTFAFRYLGEHPSTCYSLSELGDSFDQFLAETRPSRNESAGPNEPDFADFLIELTRLERIYGEVFDGPGPERSRSLQLQDFAELTAADFAACRLRLHECVRLLTFQFPVHEYASAIRHGLEPDLPASRPVFLVITRRDYIVRRFEVSARQFELLAALNNQIPVGESIFLACTDGASDVDALRRELHAWFHDWSAAPLFAELIRDGS